MKEFALFILLITLSDGDVQVTKIPVLNEYPTMEACGKAATEISVALKKIEAYYPQGKARLSNAYCEEL